jgi:hypothetical protein
MAVDDFIMTMDSDVEDVPPPPEAKSKKTQASVSEDALLDPEFSFNISEDPYADALGHPEELDASMHGSKPVRATVCWGSSSVHKTSKLRHPSLLTTLSLGAS